MERELLLTLFLELCSDRIQQLSGGSRIAVSDREDTRFLGIFTHDHRDALSYGGAATSLHFASYLIR